jgi:hypothetical protein
LIQKYGVSNEQLRKRFSENWPKPGGAFTGIIKSQRMWFLIFAIRIVEGELG